MKFQVGVASVDMIETDDRICAHIRAGRQFEPRTLEIWGAACAARGGTVIDVGAYTGLFSISAALIGCKVIAFEPMPQNANRLIENAEINGVRREIKLFPFAVSDRSGEAEITYNPNVPLTSGASLVATRGRKLGVALATIDMFDLQNVTTIKIDVERGEPEVLRGARETIERCRPLILVEVLDHERKTGVMAALPGYRVQEEIDDRNWLMAPC